MTFILSLLGGFPPLFPAYFPLSLPSSLILLTAILIKVPASPAALPRCLSQMQYQSTQSQVAIIFLRLFIDDLSTDSQSDRNTFK